MICEGDRWEDERGGSATFPKRGHHERAEMEPESAGMTPIPGQVAELNIVLSCPICDRKACHSRPRAYFLKDVA